MRRRMYFLLPDLGSRHPDGHDLLLARVEDGHMHFLAKRGNVSGSVASKRIILQKLRRQLHGPSWDL